MPEIVRRRIEVRGIVQGVGFRPFVYGLAVRRGLSGTVLNNKLGVTIEVQGERAACDGFAASLEAEAPPLARIADLRATHLTPLTDETSFRILHSSSQGDDVTLISPDFDICDDCLREMFDPADRRYRYPFTNCTNCGPRYTIINGTPYDRPFTSMAGFEMCPACRKEYEDPADRRFHAQPNACPACGPSVALYDAKWNRVDSMDPIRETAAYLAEGKIVAIKGIGGYHFGCDAANDDAVEQLRERKMRKEKPFAVMSASLAVVHGWAEVSAEEAKLLTSRERPITLLRKKGDASLSEGIAPGLNQYGVFLPYTPIQHLLFASGAPDTLVMTSGNISDEPIAFHEKELKERLTGVPDYHLTHNRPIVWRCDDSIVKWCDGRTMPIRRSRGYVPSPVFVEQEIPPLLACGGDLKSVFCLAKGNTVFPGPHIGDLWNAEAFRSFRESIGHFSRIFRIHPEVVAVDLHPNYFSSNHGRNLGLPVVDVQHHHAHIASVMAENGLDRQVIGVALDGTGYGLDGKIWGGEVMVCDYASFHTVGRLPWLRLPGGDKAAKEPWRTATALLYEMHGEGIFDAHPAFVIEVGQKNVHAVISMLEADLNCPLSNGAGRWFDAASSILLAGHHNYFEGQAPMMLEALADRSVEKEFPFDVRAEKMLGFEGMVRGMVNMSATEEGRMRAASMFHNTIARAVVFLCERARVESAADDVCLGGGVFQNGLLLERTVALLEKKGFAIHLPKQLPVNDAGLALGQALIAARHLG